MQAGNGDLQEALTNFTINSASLAIFSYLLYRDYSQQQKDQQQVAREEALGKLQVRQGSGGVLFWPVTPSRNLGEGYGRRMATSGVRAV